MGIRSILTGVMPTIFNKIGEDAIFTPLSGVPEACKATLDYDVLLQPVSIDGQAWDKATLIEVAVSTAAAALGIAISREPLAGETFTIDGVVYTVAEIINSDGFSVKMRVT